MATFYLVRHAEKEKAIGDVSITSAGRWQARKTACHFSRLPVSLIVTSPLRRAKETAEYIARSAKSGLEVDHRLRERANWGDLPEQSFEEFVEMWERSTRDPDYMPPVGDSAKQAGERLALVLSELAVKYGSGSSIVIVTHGGLITDFLVHAVSEDQLNLWHPSFIEAQSSLIPECSVTTLHYDRNACKIAAFASVGHLKPEDPI
ncbi:histidine phosphatase family protein [Paenibacillus humicola]|uniref:histidine phosphatase family protein n=1 Tax=Paenibacillus humicola TaxID=3110540 RepID=UPI00237B2445|nr:histidine phosphatase family protein [Paenibacillus humicola]